MLGRQDIVDARDGSGRRRHLQGVTATGDVLVLSRRWWCGRVAARR